MRYYLIAGEASGDLHGSNLLKALKSLDPDSEFRCWGGDLMQEQGARIVKHYRELAFMGFVEVVANLRTILKNLNLCKRDLLLYQPDALVLIDYPGFNLRIAEFAKKRGIKVYYYISPQIWAWKQNRVHKINRVVDKMMVILPFEKEFYARFNYHVDYVGHPLLDAVVNREADFSSFIKTNKLENKPIIALLPGSRKQEVRRMLRIMLGVVNDFQDYQFVIAGAPSLSKDYYQQFIGNSNVAYIDNKTYSILNNSVAALVTSGTATLETALFGVPEIVCYKANTLSYHIIKNLIKVKFISLVNLIMDREIVKEFIQDKLTVDNIRKELNKILNDQEYNKAIKANYLHLQERLGGGGASQKVASLIFDDLLEKKANTLS